MEQAQPSRTRIIVVGLLTVAMGVFTILGSLGIIAPLHSAADAPSWLGAAAGLAFALAGTAAILQATLTGWVGADGDLPATTPRWLRAIYGLIVLSILACLASMGSWVAFGPGEREFSTPFFFLGSHANAVIGRIAFGIGAVLVWLILITCAIISMRRLASPRSPK
jgi:hypothetical protein